MFQVGIPGYGDVQIKYLVSDFNGTLAVDGVLRPGVKDALNEIAQQVEVHVITADTFGAAREALADVNCNVVVLEAGRHARIKRTYMQRLGAGQAIALGNGRNDRFMLRAARIGIAVLLEEGAANEAVASADILVKDTISALDYLRKPKRLIAALRE